MNKVVLAGRVGRDPETKKVGDDLTIAKFSLATSKKVKGEDVTEWHNIVVFGKRADVIAEYVKKGDFFTMSGEIRYRSWEGDDGQKKYMTEIHLEDFTFGPKSSTNNTASAAPPRAKNESPF